MPGSTQWRPVLVPPYGWRRWVSSGSELLLRRPLLAIVVLGIAVLWTLLGHLLAEGIGTTFPSSSFYVIWPFALLGCFHSMCTGIVMARAADESCSMHNAIALMLEPRTAFRSFRVGYMHVLFVFVAGVVAHLYLGFDFTYEVMPVLRRAAASISDAAPLERATMISHVSLAILMSLAAALFPAVAGTQIATMNALGITVFPSAIDGACARPFEATRRSVIASSINCRRAGLTGWIVAPGVGVLLIVVNARGGDDTIAELYRLVCSMSQLCLLPPVVYVANREMSVGIFGNLPKGFKPIAGVLIEGKRSSTNVPD